MPSLSRLAFLLLFLTNILVFAVSSTDRHHNKFLICLKISNSESDSITYSPKNESYASILRTEILKPESASRKSPLLILTPLHQSQIQAAIQCSKKTGLQIRVRSGGHDYEGLSSSSEVPFVIVDMRNLHLIDVNVEDKTAWVEVGATLGQLYYTIAQKSRTLAFPAGTCPKVGVGGHFSGGGYGMMTRKYSLSADRIIDAKLIDADGKIHDRRSMGEDLFWAISGGGGTSFGIIVAFKVELVVVPEIVTVFNVTRTLERNATQLMHRWQYVADRVDERLLMRVFIRSIWSTTGKNRTIAASFVSLFLGHVRELLPVMRETFPELGLVEEDCTEMSWIESVLFFANLENQPPNILLNRTPEVAVYTKGKVDYVRKPIPVEGLTGIWSFLQREPGSATRELEISPYGGAMSTYSESETPFPHRAGNIFMIHYIIRWTNPTESQRQVSWIRELFKYTKRYVSKSPRAAYINYRDLDIGVNNKLGNTSYAQASIWGLKYFKTNFKRLARIKTRVDPTNFFRNEQSVPPLTTLW